MQPEELTDLNRRLRLLGWTDRAIAQAIGVQPRSLRRMENGQRPIFDDQAATLRKLVEEGEAERAARVEAIKQEGEARKERRKDAARRIAGELAKKEGEP